MKWVTSLNNVLYLNETFPKIREVSLSLSTLCKTIKETLLRLFDIRPKSLLCFCLNEHYFDIFFNKKKKNSYVYQKHL